MLSRSAAPVRYCLGKPVPDKFEVFNDYNHNLVNLFRCMRDRPMEFIRELGFFKPEFP